MNKSSQEIATVDTEAKQGKKRKLTTTQRITYIAMLIAASLVLKIIGNLFQLPFFKVTFVYVPWILAAIAMGTLGGLTVAFATDLLGTLVSGGIPNPILALSCAAFGLIMGLVFKIPKLDPKLKILIGTAIVIPVCTFGLWSLGMALYFPTKTFWGWLAIRPPQALVVALNSVITAFLFPIMRKKGLMR